METVESNDTNGDNLRVSSSPNVARQDSGVPEDAATPLSSSSKSISPETDEGDPDETVNSDCNVTVIHVSESKNYTNDENGKDGSDSGVEGCIIQVPRVRSRNSSCNGFDEASCDSSLVSCCSVYEDPCGTFTDDLRLPNPVGGVVGEGEERTESRGGEGTSEGGSESSSVAGSVSAKTSRSNNTRRTIASSSSSSSSSSTSAKKKTSSNVDPQKCSRTKPVLSSTASLSNVPTTPRSCKQRSMTPRALLSKTTTLPSSSSKDKIVRSRDKSLVRESCGSNSATTPTSESGATVSAAVEGATPRTRTRPTPDSLPSILTTEIAKDLKQRGRGASRSRGSSISRGKTPGSTPGADSEVRKFGNTAGGSLSSTVSRNLYPSSKQMSEAMTKSVMRLSRGDKMTTSLDSAKAAALDSASATLPRRNRMKLFISTVTSKPTKSANEKCNEKSNLNRPLSRDGSLSRAADKKRGVYANKNGTKGVTKVTTRIYHEVGIQTGLTGHDIENVMAGNTSTISASEIVEKATEGCQTEESYTFVDIQALQASVQRLTADNARLKAENEKSKTELTEVKKLLEEEKADHAFARQELDRNAQRVLAMLGTPQSEHAEGSDSFLELETHLQSHLQSSGQAFANQQIEIADLQSLCRMLNRDLEKSLAAQKALLQQQQELEAESSEMQDFLQEEKATLAEALKEAELEVKAMKETLTQRDSELQRQMEECKHLVRISEQRRQENLSLTMKLSAAERRSRELLLTQGAAVSGAAVALSSLGTRLEALVDQLITSYNISSKDLEDVIFHNEAYSQSNSSVESSPVSSKQHSLKDCTPSPKRGSFVSAVIGAIRNAATHPFATKLTDKKSSSSSFESTKQSGKELSTEVSSDLLDFETEPCLMMESVLEDVSLPDTYSHNMISSCDSLRRALSVPETVDETVAYRKSKLGDQCASLTNLSQAILNRRKVEDEEDNNDCESISESENGTADGPVAVSLTDYCPAVSLVDQVIDVDNLVTKLLKVLRIIQLDNDTCIQELKEEKYQLETKLENYASKLENSTTSSTNHHESSEDKSENSMISQNRLTSVLENCRNSLKEVTNGDIVDTFLV